ncbi:hypothetical protein RCH12_002720 [Cryobacterium sp. MP_3.1]|uniref:hypothetical protein n=1 Tax=Cryobacterium sp. MP_3.1 TaxID=3071711 RepID=UPI002E0487AA|nr:hypothetical protein [Cryobacterium sp. MP_3.1]
MDTTTMTPAYLAAENYRIGSEHEAAHALAYMVHGLSFDHITLDDAGTGLVQPPPRMISNDVAARVALAGQVMDLNWHRQHNGDEALCDIMDYWDCAADDEDAHDIHNVRQGTGFAGLIWAFAFADANAELIAQAGRSLVKAGGFMTGSEFAEAVNEMPVEPSHLLRSSYVALVEPYMVRLMEIEQKNV